MGPLKYHEIVKQEHFKAGGKLKDRGPIKKNGTKYQRNGLFPVNTE
jgi:hypothetical protein